MIGFLRGQLLRLEPETALLDVGGVGYVVRIPLATYHELQRSVDGAEISLDIFTHVREDTLALYGFSTPGEKALFEKLIGISGIGPKLAQAVLSGMPLEDLTAAIAGGDVRRLSTISGIGKRTAERIVLELKEKVEQLPTTPKAAPQAIEGDLSEALVGLGYRRGPAEKAIVVALREHPDAEFAELLRACLRQLSGA